ncbi:hypothetical protein E1301_Tti013290 [Triplophysa tibetana]|uniref:Uncharacterized protein n=1 Tax=Triplophysa tibetana TaxID=1572043 RepID=A0A5A9N339_9TELE|nr:hypothetical protein E1301_Tti013290 [Triplophysa tibetana]
MEVEREGEPRVVEGDRFPVPRWRRPITCSQRPLLDYDRDVEARKASVPEVLVRPYLVSKFDNPPRFPEREEMVYQPSRQLVERLQL